MISNRIRPSIPGSRPRQPRSRTLAMKAERFAGREEREALMLSVAGVTAIMLYREFDFSDLALNIPPAQTAKPSAVREGCAFVETVACTFQKKTSPRPAQKAQDLTVVR